MFSLDEKQYMSCYSSEPLQEKDMRSINYVIAVKDKQKINLLQYRLKWSLSMDGYVKWEKVELLGDYKIFGCDIEFDDDSKICPI